LDLPLDEAWEAKVAEDQEKASNQKAGREKKRKEREETAGEEGQEPEQKKPRSKYLRTSAEERAHWEEKKESMERKAAEKAVREDQKQEEKGKGKAGKLESGASAVKAVRAMSLRLYPSKALEMGLLSWIGIADDMDAHVKEVVETFAGRGEKISFEYARNEYVCLSRVKYNKLEKEGRLGELKDLERRRKYIDMPYDVQQSTIKETVGNTKSNQTNYERGHNRGYEVEERDGNRRWKTLNFLASGMRVDNRTGEVTMYPRSNFVSEGGGRGLYLKDRIIRFLCPEEDLGLGDRKRRLPTKMWGNHLQCGKDNGGQGFKIRYDSLGRKWYLILSYDAKIRGAPFQSGALDKILSQTDSVANRAKIWISRFERLFNNDVPKGNMAAIDPGFRTPFTCFDAHRRLCYGVFPDMVGKLADIGNEIALLQRRTDLAANAVGTGGKRYKTRYAKERRRKKRESRKKRKRKRKRAKSCTWQIRRLYDLQKAITRQAHGAFANHLVRYYDTIVLPEFMTANMVRKRRQHLKLPPVRDLSQLNTTPKDGKFTLHRTTRKAMRWISHYAFRQRLFAKALADPYGVKDVICNTEEYTTKQCPFCDFVHHKIGSNKIFKCEKCGFVGGRDPVGCFNVGLRSIVKNEIRVLS
jgi:transposase